MYMYARDKAVSIELIADIKYADHGAFAPFFDVLLMGAMLADFISLDESILARIAHDVENSSSPHNINDCDEVAECLGMYNLSQFTSVPIFMLNWKDVNNDDYSLSYELLRISHSIVALRTFFDMRDTYNNAFNSICDNTFLSIISSLIEPAILVPGAIFLTDKLEIDFIKSEPFFNRAFWWDSDVVISSNNLERTSRLIQSGMLSIINNTNNEASSIEMSTFAFSDPLGGLMQSVKEILRMNLPVRKCKNCGMYFIPSKRSDAIYCDRQAPQDNSKTCKEYGARQAWQKTLKENEAAGLYRKIYMSKQMLAKRNPDLPDYQLSFEKYKALSKQWKSDVKSGTKTEAEYIEWLKSVKEKKVL